MIIDMRPGGNQALVALAVTEEGARADAGVCDRIDAADACEGRRPEP